MSINLAPSPSKIPQSMPTRIRVNWHAWRIAVGLLALSAVPVLAGIARLISLASHENVANENKRFFDSPLPVVIHIVGVVIFCVAGAVQFVPTLRVSGHRWHRYSGRAVAPAGIAVALSGLWMTHRYRLPVSDNSLLNRFRDIAGLWMLVTLTIALTEIRRRRYSQHGIWMGRAVAVGLGAGTQVFTHLPWIVAFGKPPAGVRAWLMFSGWAINVAVFEAWQRNKHQRNKHQ